VRRRGACDSRGQLNNASLHRRSTFDEQRNAIAEIAYGRAKGNGPFALFAATLRYVLDPKFVHIEMRVDGERSCFAVRECSKSNSLHTSIPFLARSMRCALTFPTVSFSRARRRSRPRQ
jgi:hypothetical protein